MTLPIPVEIVYREIPKTSDLETLINEKTEKLYKFCNFMTSCRVSVEQPQQHQRTGSPYRVRVDIRIPPGHEVVVRHEPGEGDMHEPLETVVREVFNSAERQVKQLTEKLRGDTKKHPEQQVEAIVIELNSDEDHGYIRAVDGRRIYFHRHAVLHDEFDRLSLGTGVNYEEEMGESGPQASSVRIIAKTGAQKDRR